MFNKFFKIISLSIIFVSLLCVGGVYASFEFAQNSANNAFNEYNVGIVDFVYDNNTLFPSTESGKVNGKLIDNLVNGTDEYDGLNNPNSDISIAIKNRKEEYFNLYDDGNSEIIGSVDSLRGNAIKRFIPENSNMTIIISFSENDDNYYVYSTDVEIPQNQYIRISPVYKSTLIKNDEGNYYVSSVEIGSTLCNYDYYNYNMMMGEILVATTINIDTWEAL